MGWAEWRKKMLLSALDASENVSEVMNVSKNVGMGQRTQ